MPRAASPAPPRRVPLNEMVQRLAMSGEVDKLTRALQANPGLKRRLHRENHRGGLAEDDAELHSVLKKHGIDPDKALARGPAR